MLEILGIYAQDRRNEEDEMGKSFFKVLSTRTWYGSGHCKICGDTAVVPMQVRFWDPDDGLQVGVLCEGCTLDARKTEPSPEDYAYSSQAKLKGQAEIVSALSDIYGGDHDALAADLEDLG